ncbi:hypothetical protein [Actinocorallia longicatena]|uniref:hypothetical protein n=1 Tax=Actinocorallia longicatena TaxID=111803 RepID=UPI0031D1B73F
MLLQGGRDADQQVLRDRVGAGGLVDASPGVAGERAGWSVLGEVMTGPPLRGVRVWSVGPPPRPCGVERPGR